jgi:hypothetical protein
VSVRLKPGRRRAAGAMDAGEETVTVFPHNSIILLAARLIR